MPETRNPEVTTPSRIGSLLLQWRQLRNKSQLALANEADVSPRHLCFVETGRARPSREMVLTLAGALQVPLRERNALLLAAGFAPLYQETTLDAPELAAARKALDTILRHHEPLPAVVMNRHWDILETNTAAARFFAFLLGSKPPANPNVIRAIFDPAGLRPCIRNWEQVAEALIHRVHREAIGGVPDAKTLALLEQALAFPGVPRRFRIADLETPLSPIVPITFVKDDLTFEYFSMVTTLGTPQDVTLQELRIECFFPMDEATTRNAERLAKGSSQRIEQEDERSEARRRS
jgi:transcriptional regulator with XRE-family HTH domain